MKRIIMATLLAACGCGGGAGRVDAGGSDGGGAMDGGAPDGGHDAGPPEPCETAGELESVPCGACGTVERFCTADLVWAYGTCEGQGECAPGTIDDLACGNCGTQSVRCGTTCEWEVTGACSGEGECEPGTSFRSTDGCPSGESRTTACSDACVFEESECGPETCETAGTTETTACGACGTVERFCTAENVWAYAECEGEGACVPGSTRVTDCGRCGSRTERCTVECAWEPHGACSGEGECSPGESMVTVDGCPSGEQRELSCGDACAWTEITACMAGFAIVDIQARACRANAFDLRFETTEPADHVVNARAMRTDGSTVERTCMDATLQSSHAYGDVGSCSADRLTTSSVPNAFPIGQPVNIDVVSRNAAGRAATASVSLTLPTTSDCICVERVGGDGCERADCADASAYGLDLETGAVVPIASADLWVTGTISGGHVTAVDIHTPTGLVTRTNTQLCDVLDFPASGFDTSPLPLYRVGGGTTVSSGRTTLLLRTRAGRAAKVLYNNVAIGNDGVGTTLLGFSLTTILAPPGSTTFDR